MRALFFIACSVALAGCAETTVTPVSKNQIIITTSAEADCGASGAAKVASKMAAVETIRHGYQRYIISGTAADSSVAAIRTGPTYATSYSNGAGAFSTYFGGEHIVLTGEHTRNLGVIMLNPGDPGFNQALDAKSVLGTEWPTLVKNGVTNCI